MKTIQEMTQELIGAGMTEGGIARAVGCGQSTIHRIKRGSDTKHSIALKIIDIHRTEIAQCGESLAA